MSCIFKNVVSKAVRLTSDSENSGSEVHGIQCQISIQDFEVIVLAHVKLNLFIL